MYDDHEHKLYKKQKVKKKNEIPKKMLKKNSPAHFQL